MSYLKAFERYFGRNPVRRRLSFADGTRAIVVVPVLNDPDIFATVDSLCRCTTEEGRAGVAIVVNHSEELQEDLKAENVALAQRLREYCRDRQNGRIAFDVLEAFDLPAKRAGVGLARKIAMDAAADFFFRRGMPDAPILSLDADTWVDANYFDETVRFFAVRPAAGASLACEHRLDLPGLGEAGRDAVVKYELYLRYYRLALEYAGHPYAFHCIGSAFAVRAEDYVAQGGMNQRQAGEDFYFLQKLMATGRYAALKSVKVYPSPRFSDRTPFGTGRAVRWIVEHSGSFPVYNPLAFRDLKCFFEGIRGLYGAGGVETEDYFRRQAEGVREFLCRTGGLEMVAEVNANCASEAQFAKRFFGHFNAFQVLKYLNFVHEGRHPKVEVRDAAKALLVESGLPVPESAEDMLLMLRNFRPA